MTAAAVVLTAVLFAVVTTVVLLTFLVLSVAALVIRVVVMAIVTFLMLSVATFMLREKVYVLRSLHPCRLKAVSELNASDAWNCKHGVGQNALHAIPEGFSKADRKAFHHAFNHSAKGIAIGRGGLKGLRPFLCVSEPADLLEDSVELSEVHHLFGNYARRNYSQGKPAAELAAAAGVVVTAVLEIGREVRVTLPWVLTEGLVVLRAGVFVA